MLLIAATFTWLLSLPLRNVSIVDPLKGLMLFAAGVIYGLGADPRAPRLAFVLWLLALWAARQSIYLTARGMGVRSQRYSMLVDDGTVKALNVEAPGKFEVSDADNMLKAL